MIIRLIPDQEKTSSAVDKGYKRKTERKKNRKKRASPDPVLKQRNVCIKSRNLIF